MKKLYFGSNDGNIQYITKGKFLTQFITIASCFIFKKQDLFGEYNKPYNSINWSYDIWELPIKQLQKNNIPKHIDIYNNAKYWIETMGNSTGYIYQIECDQYVEKHLQAFDDHDIRLQCIYNGFKKIKTKLIKKINVDWTCQYKKFMSNHFGFAVIGIDKYQKPYTTDILKQKYPKLLNDPAHKWRAKTGIELIHKEPDFQQQKRIFYNFNLMSEAKKEKSDRKSKQLFGQYNIEHHHDIMQHQWHDENYFELNKIRRIYNKRDMQLNGWNYIHISLSDKPLIMKPRVPKNFMKFSDKQFKLYQQNKKIPRICCSNSIFGALSAIHINPKKIYYVHLLQPQNVIENIQVSQYVPDAIATGECWILDDEIKTKVVGKIIINQPLPYTFAFVKASEHNFYFCGYYDYDIEF